MGHFLSSKSAWWTNFVGSHFGEKGLDQTPLAVAGVGGARTQCSAMQCNGPDRQNKQGGWPWKVRGGQPTPWTPPKGATVEGRGGSLITLRNTPGQRWAASGKYGRMGIVLRTSLCPSGTSKRTDPVKPSPEIRIQLPKFKFSRPPPRRKLSPGNAMQFASADFCAGSDFGCI